MWNQHRHGAIWHHGSPSRLGGGATTGVGSRGGYWPCLNREMVPPLAWGHKTPPLQGGTALGGYPEVDLVFLAVFWVD
jgi:hypothetical protein